MGAPTKEAVIGTFINGRNAQDDFLQLKSSMGGNIFAWIDYQGNLQGTFATGLPGGSDTDVQFNQGGVFGGNAGFSYDYSAGVAPALTKIATLSISAPGNSDTAPILELFGIGTGGDYGSYIFLTPTTGAGNTGSTRGTVGLIGMDQTGGFGVSANQNGRDAGGFTMQGTTGDVPGALEVGVWGIIDPNNNLTELFFTPDGGIDFYLASLSVGIHIDSSANTSFINVIPATSLANQNSPTIAVVGSAWIGSASPDTWYWQNVLGSGTNPVSTLTLTHTSGSSGNPEISMPYPITLGVINISGLTSAGAVNILNGNSLSFQTSNAAQQVSGESSELLTLSTGGTTTDTTGNLLPAGAIIDAVLVRVTTTISGGSTPTTWEAGDATTAARFISTGNTLTSGTTAVGLNQMQGGVSTNAAGPVQTSAAKVRITLDQTPGQGAVRITVYWRMFTAPTS